MSGEPWTDGDGGELWAAVTENGMLGLSAGAATRVEVDDLERFTSWLYEQAGRVPPVMLGRPEVNPEVSARLGSFGVWLTEGGDVVFAFGSSAIDIDTEGALKVAALIAAYAEASRARKAEPGPEDVTRLTGLIAAAREKHGGWPLSMRDFAADLLRAGVSLPGEGSGNGD